MRKSLKEYSFFIGLVGGALSILSVILDFFGVIEVMPIITEIIAIVSAILVSVGVVEKSEKANSFDDLKDDIKNDLTKDNKNIKDADTQTEQNTQDKPNDDTKE